MALTNETFPMGIGTDTNTKHAVMAAIAAGLTAYIFGTLATGIVVGPPRLLKAGCQIFLVWTSIGVALVGFVGLKYYSRVPGSTIWRKAGWVAGLGAFPVFVTGQLIPWTRPITHGFGFVPDAFGLPVNILSHAVTSVACMFVFFYVYRELQRGIAGEGTTTGAVS